MCTVSRVLNKETLISLSVGPLRTGLSSTQGSIVPALTQPLSPYLLMAHPFLSSPLRDDVPLSELISTNNWRCDIQLGSNHFKKSELYTHADVYAHAHNAETQRHKYTHTMARVPV